MRAAAVSSGSTSVERQQQRRNPADRPPPHCAASASTQHPPVSPCAARGCRRENRQARPSCTPPRPAKKAFLSHLYIETMILPRQARDKHREISKKDAVLRTFSSCVVSDDATHNQTQRTVSKAVPYILMIMKKSIISTARSFDQKRGADGCERPLIRFVCVPFPSQTAHKPCRHTQSVSI
jgi:hypothetical protein